MYNKIFGKILDSSIWLEPSSTRVIWMMFIAAMDEDGMVQFASVANVAHRAIVPMEDAEKAIAALEGPDANSSDPEFDGRRIERVEGGWIVLNAPKYRELVTREMIKEQTRMRVARFRHKKNKKHVTHRNGLVTASNETVTPSVADTDTSKSTPSGTPEGSFIDDLKKLSAYKGIDIDRELSKMEAWLLTPKGKGRKLTKGFVVNWLNRLDAQIATPDKPKSRAERDWEELQERKKRMGQQ